MAIIDKLLSSGESWEQCIPSKKFVCQQPKLQMPNFWSRGAPKIRSGAQRGSIVTGFFDVSSNFDAKNELNVCTYRHLDR